MRTPTRTLVTACALSAAFLVAGCGGDDGDKDQTSGGSSGELFLEPVAAQGSGPFTDSTAASTATPPPVTRTQQPTPKGGASATQGARKLSGSTPGLYGGVHSAGSCDVEKQIGLLTADRAKARAFAQVTGVSQASVPNFLRGLTSVVLRADTQVTNHEFSDGRATGRQSVLQAGTAVLVDNRGVPRVRCACGNPLRPPVESKGAPGTHGQVWSGYRPGEVVFVTPATTVITNITIINIVDNAWIERRIGDDGHRHDHVVRPPDDWTRSPEPEDSSSGARPREDGTWPDESASDCVTPTVTVTPGETGAPEETESAPGDPSDRAPDEPADCATATVTAPPTTDPGSTPTPSDESTTPESETGTITPDQSTPEIPSATEDFSTPEEPSTLDEPSSPLDSTTSTTSTEEVGPDTVPESPDLPDGGGLIPDDPTMSDSIFDAATDMSGS
ncbi:DUF6777 domain-containing protein [Streptomyces sp. NBC_00038]|uniref:DUF6777 domain-containing protein n=1 Tax=Streptomyces sp. NBC_00038 TaxID=2903615 RepID=UPI0022501152|nr:DUF6777 domain-containing protein [Streptomyces sp. NBC_00038]MCX5562654.1 hypothetical protein [Streptomyces sp. NBC_00038]